MSVTLKEIADKLHVSVSTVSKGLSGARDISELLRQEILDAAVEMGYKPKRMLREEHKKIALLIENMAYRNAGDFCYDIVLGFKQMAFREKWTVDIIEVDGAMQRRERYDSYMLRHEYTCAFMLGLVLDDPWMKQLSETDIPTVLLDTYVKRNPAVGYVGTDPDESFEMAIEHLVGLGHRKIAFLNGSKGSFIAEKRESLFKKYLDVNGIEPDRSIIVNGDYTEECARIYTEIFLNAGATAIMCGNDIMAKGVVEECEKRGFSVPGDISVIGYDDIPLASSMYPPLTTIRQDRLELGKSAFFTLNSLCHNVPIGYTMLKPKLVLRATASEVPKKRKNISK